MSQDFVGNWKTFPSLPNSENQSEASQLKIYYVKATKGNTVSINIEHVLTLF